MRVSSEQVDQAQQPPAAAPGKRERPPPAKQQQSQKRQKRQQQQQQQAAAAIPGLDLTELDPTADLEALIPTMAAPGHAVFTGPLAALPAAARRSGGAPAAKACTHRAAFTPAAAEQAGGGNAVATADQQCSEASCPQQQKQQQQCMQKGNAAKRSKMAVGVDIATAGDAQEGILSSALSAPAAVVADAEQCKAGTIAKSGRKSKKFSSNKGATAAAAAPMFLPFPEAAAAEAAAAQAAEAAAAQAAAEAAAAAEQQSSSDDEEPQALQRPHRSAGNRAAAAAVRAPDQHHVQMKAVGGQGAGSRDKRNCGDAGQQAAVDKRAGPTDAGAGACRTKRQRGAAGACAGTTDNEKRKGQERVEAEQQQRQQQQGEENEQHQDQEGGRHDQQDDEQPDDAAAPAGASHPARVALSGMHTRERDQSAALLTRLRISCLKSKHQGQAGTTHIVSPDLRRYEKSVCGLAAGVWLVGTGFLNACKAAGKLADPLPHELHEGVSGSIADGGWRGVKHGMQGAAAVVTVCAGCLACCINMLLCDASYETSTRVHRLSVAHRWSLM